MKKSIAVLGFSIACLGAFAQQKEEAAPKMFKVDAVQKINASIYQLVHNPVPAGATNSGTRTSTKPSAFVRIRKDATEFDKSYFFNVEEKSGGHHISNQTYIK